ncbi:hypothetical protein ACFYZ6_34880 [Streptomyces rubiginosohelvolus]|uniref:hypothetical protein n=1 Tax=Streptomyces rubiginosohelvolus TaxID=67362 RepID=UPI003681BD7C
MRTESEKYLRMPSGNRMLCQLSLRWRLSPVTRSQRDLYADNLLANATCHDYWRQFGSYREAEALGEEFNRSLGDAYQKAMVPPPAKTVGP